MGTQTIQLDVVLRFARLELDRGVLTSDTLDLSLPPAVAKTWIQHVNVLPDPKFQIGIRSANTGDLFNWHSHRETGLKLHRDFGSIRQNGLDDASVVRSGPHSGAILVRLKHFDAISDRPSSLLCFLGFNRRNRRRVSVWSWRTSILGRCGDLLHGDSLARIELCGWR